MAKNILVCDDAAFMRMMIKDILTKNGYNVAGEAENSRIQQEHRRFMLVHHARQPLERHAVVSVQPFGYDVDG